MKIDIGLPSEYSISGVEKRIQKMNKIQAIHKGLGLDFGTGKGAYFNELLKYVEDLYALDKTVTFLKEGNKNIVQSSNKFFASSSEYCSVKSESFDTVFAIEVLEHVEDLEKSLMEINRILKPEGCLYLTVPNKYFPLETHLIHFGKLYIKGKYVPFLSMNEYIHSKIGSARRFSQKDLNKFSSKYGFYIIGIDYMMPPFDYWNLGRKTFLRIGNFIEESFLNIFSMTLIAVLKKT